MDDILDEREQWEQVKKWLLEQGPWVLGGIALAVAGLVGWRYWQARTERLDLAASGQYERVIGAFSRSDFVGGIKLADALVAQYPRSAYANQAQLAAARIDVETSSVQQAVPRLTSVMNSTRDPELALIARLRLARVQVDLKQYDAALTTLSGAAPGAFASRFAEVRGDALLAKGDRAGALKAYRDARATGGPSLDAGEQAPDLLDLKINELARS